MHLSQRFRESPRPEALCNHSTNSNFHARVPNRDSHHHHHRKTILGHPPQEKSSQVAVATIFCLDLGRICKKVYVHRFLCQELPRDWASPFAGRQLSPEHRRSCSTFSMHLPSFAHHHYFGPGRGLIPGIRIWAALRGLRHHREQNQAEVTQPTITLHNPSGLAHHRTFL